MTCAMRFSKTGEAYTALATRPRKATESLTIFDKQILLSDRFRKFGKEGKQPQAGKRRGKRKKDEEKRGK